MSRKEATSRKPQARRRRAPFVWVLLLASGIWLLASTHILAQPTQEEVLRSIGQNLDKETGDSSRAMSLLLAGAGIAILLLVLSQRRKREVAPKALNHHGKLLREIARSVNLKPGELRQLKLLAEQQNLSSPITLLLCPSLLSKAVNNADGKIDRRMMSAVARKLAA